MQEVEDLRVRGIDLVRLEAGGDAELMALRPRLEQDTEWRATIWAPSCAMSALRLGDPDEAWRLLDYAVANRFHQHEMFHAAGAVVYRIRW
jgi:hypothetical protein